MFSLAVEIMDSIIIRTKMTSRNDMEYEQIPSVNTVKPKPNRREQVHYCSSEKLPNVFSPEYLNQSHGQ